jgi:hypothetical protein
MSGIGPLQFVAAYGDSWTLTERHSGALGVRAGRSAGNFLWLTACYRIAYMPNRRYVLREQLVGEINHD